MARAKSQKAGNFGNLFIF